MAFQVEYCHLEDVVVLVPSVFSDNRGYFMKAYREDQLRELRASWELRAGQPLIFEERKRCWWQWTCGRGLQR